MTSDPTVERRRYSTSRRVRVDRVGSSLLVSVGRVRRSEQKLAKAFPSESGRIAVLMTRPDTELMPVLAKKLARYVPFVWDSVRLVSACAGRVGDGTPPAQVLSDMLSVEVLAPDGRLLSVPGGSVFVRSERGRPDSGAWWRFRPGRAPETAGRRFPTPEWERDLSAFSDPRIPGVIVDELPAGLWVHWPGQPRPTDMAFAVPVHRENMALVVSRAGDPPLRTADLTRLIQAMPEELIERLTVIPYGDEPVAEARLGAVVSLAANRTLRVRTGMPLHVKQGGTQVVAVSGVGVPTWRPFARELAWRPHGGSRILTWAAPARYLLPAGQAQLLLNERWMVEIIEAGLWVREADRLDGAGLIRQIPLKAKYCTVVVGVDGDSLVGPPWRTIRRLLRRLPHDARSRLRLVVPRGGGPRLLRAATRAARRLFVSRAVYVLTQDGRLARQVGRRGQLVESARIRRSRMPETQPWVREGRRDDDRRDLRAGQPGQPGHVPGGGADRAGPPVQPQSRPDAQGQQPARAAAGGPENAGAAAQRARAAQGPPVVPVPDLVVSEQRDGAPGNGPGPDRRGGPPVRGDGAPGPGDDRSDSSTDEG